MDFDIARDRGELLRKVRALVEALAFYADEENWQWQDRGAWEERFEPEEPPAYQDGGKLADDALETVRTAPLLTEYLDAMIVHLKTAELMAEAFLEHRQALVDTVNELERTMRSLRRGDTAKSKADVKSILERAKAVTDDDKYYDVLVTALAGLQGEKEQEP
jgi:hypothetical protein